MLLPRIFDVERRAGPYGTDQLEQWGYPGYACTGCFKAAIYDPAEPRICLRCGAHTCTDCDPDSRTIKDDWLSMGCPMCKNTD